jgi:hypothetical protein
MALTPTTSYARYKSQSDALLDFAVLVAHSMPALRNQIRMVESGALRALPTPDFFHKSNRSAAADLLKTEANYEQYLASYVLLAHFSFFESFVENLVEEMVAFHGGEDKFVDRVKRRIKRFLTMQSPQLVKTKRKLQDTERAKYRDSYRKYSQDLEREGFRFPADLLAAYGVRSLIVKMKNLQAVQIPDLLVDAFQVDLSKAEVDKYHQIRSIRNSVAHGEPIILTMKEAVVMNGTLRELAVRISSHISEHFFVIERYFPGNPFST